MKKRVLSLFLAIALCLTLTPTGALAAEGQPPEQTVSVTQVAETGVDENASPAKLEENPTEDAPAAAEKNTADEETGKETGKQAVQNEPTMEGKNEPLTLNDAGQNTAGGGIYVAPGSPTEGGGGTYIPVEDTRTEIWCVSKPDSIGRSYDGTTDGGTIPIDLTFTDGTNEIKLKERTDFTATKTFDSADAGWHTVTVKIALIGEAAVKYKLKAGEETFTIGGYINKACPDLTVTLSKTACTAGEKLLPLLSVEGAPEDAKVTYYYLASEYKSWAGSSDVEGSEAMPKIDENTAISEPGTYYVYAKSGGTTNYEENRSATVELTVTEPAAASVTKADGTDGGTYKTLPAALDAAQDGDTVKLLADHTTNWDNVDAGDEQMAVVRKTLTLDLNGMTVDYLTVGDVVPDEAGGIIDSYDGNLTVVDNAQGGSCGKIKDLEFVKGSLTIQGGRIGGSLTCDGNSGTVTISGGTVCYVTVGDGATVTVTGGTGHAGTWCNDGTLNITDGTFGDVQFLNNGGTIAISGGTFGTITNINGSGSIPLMPLLADNYAFYQGDNAQNSTEKKLTNVTVKPHTHSFENGKCDCGVAAIVVDNNNSCYSTLQAALDAAANNATITSVTLGQDLTEDVMFSGSAAGSLTLNMNGHKLETEAGVPLIVTGGTLRIEGAGEINQNTASNATAFPAIALTGGKLVIAGDLTAQGGYDSSSGRKPAIRAEEGELDLQGNVSLNGGLTMLGNAKLTNLLTKGTFYAQDPNGNATADNVLAVCVQQEDVASDNYNTVLKLIADGYAIYKADGTVKNAAALTLKSDTYTIKSHTCSYTQDEAHGIAYCSCGRSHAHRDLSEETSVLVNGICPICGYHCPHNNIGDDGVCTDCHAKMVAKVTVGETTTYTADLADALNKAANGTTITLLADTEISAYVNIYDETATNADQMVVTLDLAGHTVTSGNPIVIGADRNGAASHYGTLKIVGTGNIALDYVSLDTREKGVLDLTDWTGKSISSVTVTKIGNKNEGKLIVGKDAGHIGRLAFALVNCPSAEITKTKLNGGSYGEITTITNGSGTPSLAGLLPNGCVFKKEDGSFAEATASNLFNVTVSACDHGGKNGFDESATACPYCNAPAVAETALNHGEGNRPWRRFADLQTALDADRDGGAEFKLLTDVTGNYTINGTQNTALDLNGHSIKGTVTVKAAAGSNTTTLSNTENTTTVSIDKVVAHKGAKLAGSGYPAVIGELTLADTTKWKDILQQPTRLGFKVTSADGTYKWYAPNDVKGSQLNNVIINSLPITTKTLNLKVDGKSLTGNPPKVERGTTVQLCASCNAKGADVYIYTGEIVGNNMPAYSRKKAEYQKIGTNWYYVVDLAANTIGTYDIYFTASKDGYSVTSSHKKLTVTKATIPASAITAPAANALTYNGNEQALIIAGSVTSGGTMQYSLTKNGTYSQDIPTGTDTGTYTVWYRVIGDANHNDTAPASVAVRIRQKPLTITGVTAASKPYDGTTNADISSVTFDNVTLNRGTDYNVTASFDDASVGNGKNITATVTLMGQAAKNYALEQSSFPATGSITKATVPMNNPTGTLNIINGTCQTYTYDFNNLLPGLSEGEYGTISYGQANISLVSQSEYYYDASTAVSDRGVLTLAQFSANDGKMTGRIGDIKVTVTTTNYENFQLKLVLNAVNRITPVPDDTSTITASEITYGDELSASTITGTMKDPNTGYAVNGTFAWTDGTIKPDANDSYEAEWTFTPKDGNTYTEATGKATVKVAPKSIEGATITLEKREFTYNAAEQSPNITGVTLKGWSDTITYHIVDGDKATNANDSIPLTIEGTGNYIGTATAEWKITPAKLTVSVQSVTKEYDGTANATVTPTFIGLQGGDTLTAEDYSVTAAFENAKVGYQKIVTGKMTLNQRDTAKNYRLKDGNFSTDDGTITKAAAPTVQPVELTIYNGVQKDYFVDLPPLPELGKGKSYGTVEYRKTPTINLSKGYTAQSAVGADPENKNTLRLLLHMTQTGSLTGKIGTVTIPVTTSNYQDITLTVNVSAVNQIKPMPDGEITATPITYGDTLSKSKISGKMKDPDTGYAVNGTFTWVDGTVKPDAGSNNATWTFTPDASYGGKYTTNNGTATVTVNRKTVTVSGITAKDKAYDGNTNVVLDYSAVTLGGVLKNDTLTVTATGTLESAGVGEQKVTVSDLTLGGASAANYVLAESGNQSETTATITAKEVTITITSKGGTYGSVVAAAAKLTGAVDGDNVPVTLTYTGNNYSSATVPVNVGSYTVTASIANSNYTLTGKTTADFVITPKAVTVSGITAKDKVYDGNTNVVLDYSKVVLDGILENDTLTVTATGAWESAGVGEQKVTISDLTLGGDSAANYVLAESGNQAETTATITAKKITVSITPNGGAYGETITPATVTANDVVGEDAPKITLTYTGTANDGTKYNGTTLPTKAGTYTITATIKDPNYKLDAGTATAEFTVTKRPATVTPDNKSKVYEEKDPELTYKGSGVLDGETLEGITLARAKGENAGKYAITATADVSANPNYDVTFAEGTFTIEPKSIEGATVVLGKGLAANGAEQTQTVEKVLLDDKEIPADSYTVTGNTATAPGSHTLTITAKGNYTGTVEQAYVIVPAKAEDAPGEEIAIGSGEVKVVVKSEGTVPPATLLTNKAELLAMLVDSGDITADELAQIADGASVDIVLTVKEANVSAEIKTAMAQAAKDYTIGQYLDISLFKYMTVNGSQQAGVALHTTKDALTISVVVLDALINTNSAVNRNYCIVRNHEGTITVLDAAFDAANKTLTFKTDRFSDYAIAYKDTAVPSSSNPSNNNSSNDSETKKNEVAPTPAPTPASTPKPSTITAMPQTGDTSNPTLYVVLLVVSLLGLAVVFVCKRRNNK